jgi:N-acetylglucosaminyldiphosphoundecaprenol N-acetyl-beta-D-mannosaminyltransferase
MTESLLIGGIPTLRASRQQLAAAMVADCAAARSGRMVLPRVLTSSNGSVIARFHRDAVFRDLMMKVDAVDADGQPLVIASRLFCTTALEERVATTDFIHDAAEAAAAHGLRFYFLGGNPGVAEGAAEKLRARHRGLRIVGMRDGYFNPNQEDALCTEIVGLGTDVLWVGLGSPAQESFAIRNRMKLAGLAWIKTCGGLFDHCSERVSRAPVWMQRAGLEWLYRMVKEPRRLGPRYLTTNLPAIYHLLTNTSDDPSSPRRGSAPI